MRKIIVLFGLLGFLLSGYYATWQINLLERGFTVAQIATLIAISTTCSRLFDLPSSVIADRIGHKTAVLFGCLLFALGFLIPSFSINPLSLAATVIVVTIGEAILEGAMDAWCSDIQRASKGQVTSYAFMGLDQAQRIGMISGSLIIPTLITFVGKPLHGGWFIYAILAGGVLGYALTIPAGTQEAAHPYERRKPALIELKGHFGSKTLLVLLACSFFFGLSDGANQTAFWPKLKEIGISTPMILGFIQAGMSLSRLLGLQLWKRSHLVESARLPAISLIGSSLFFVIFALVSTPILALPAWFIRIMVMSAFFSAQRGLIQKLYGKSKWRATIVSAVSTTAQLGTISLTSGVGIFGTLSASMICIAGSVFSLIAGVMFLRFKTVHTEDLPA